MSVSMSVHSKLVHPIYFLKINDFYTFNCSLVLKLLNFFNYNSLRRENIFAKLQEYDNLAHRSEFCLLFQINIHIYFVLHFSNRIPHLLSPLNIQEMVYVHIFIYIYISNCFTYVCLWRGVCVLKGILKCPLLV